MRNSAPVIACFKSALGWVNYGLVIAILDVPLGRKLNQPVQDAFLHLRIQPSLIEWIQIVTNMHEFSAVKHFTVSLAFDVCAHEPTHPIIGDDNGREDLKLAKGLQSDEREENKLFCDIECPFSIIRL